MNLLLNKVTIRDKLMNKLNTGDYVYQIEGSIRHVTLVGAVKLLLSGKVPSTEGVGHRPLVLSASLIPVQHKLITDDKDSNGLMY